MSRPARIALAAAGAALVLAAAAALAAPYLLPVERFLPEIESRVSEVAGMPIRIGSLRLRPGLGIRAEATDIRFGADSRARPLEIDRLRVGVRLLPLLRGEVRIGSTAAEGVRLRLRRGPDRQWRPDAGAAVPAPRGRPPADAPRSGAGSVPVERILLRDVRVTFIDPAGPPALRRGWTLGPARATVEPAGDSRPWRFSLDARLGEKSGAEVSLTGVFPPSGPAGSTLHLEIQDLGVEPAAALLAVAGQRMPEGVRSGSLSGALDVRAGDGGFEASGRLDLTDLEVRVGSGVRAGSLRADATLALEKGGARLSPLRVRLGEESIEGDLVWKGGAVPELSGDLRSKRLDLDRVLELLAAAPGAAPRTAAAAPASPAPPAARGTLRLAIGSGRVVGLEFSGARVEAALDRGRLELRSLSAALYGGEVKGSGAVTLGRDPLPYEIRADARGVDLEGALPALRPDLKGLLTGRFTGALALEGAGVSSAEILRALSGALRLDLRDGQVASISVLQQVAALLEAAGGKGIGRESTPYRSLGGDFRLERGRARTKNLALRSEDLDLDGEGSFGLDATLDFDVAARFATPVSEAMVAKTSNLRHLVEKDGRLLVRFRLVGPLAAPKVVLDQAFLRSRLKRAAEERAREKLRDRLQDLLR